MTRCSRKKRTMLLTALAAAAVFSGGMSGKAFAAETAAGEEEIAAEQVLTGADDVKDDTEEVMEGSEDKSEDKTDNNTKEMAVTDAGPADSGEDSGVSADSGSISDTEDASNIESDKESDKESDSHETGDVTGAVDGISSDEADTSPEDQTAQDDPEDPLLVPSTSDTDGWYQDGSDYYYYQNGKLVKEKVIEIKGQLYCFYSSGKMVKNTTYYLYDEQLGRYAYYRAKENGMLYRSSWYQNDAGDWHYYGADGKGVSGIVTLGGKKYLFDVTGLLMVGRAVYVNGVAYAGTNDGQPKKLKNEGWDQAGGQWFYLVGGRFKINSLEKIDGEYYLFTEDGRMLKEGETYSLTNYDQVSGINIYLMYRAEKGGKLCRNEWFYDEEHFNWLYYGEGCSALTGYHKIGNDHYLFNSYNGAMIRSMAGKWEDGYCYVVDSEGHASRMPQNGWGKLGTNYYYLRDGQFVYGEVIEDKGKLYGFSGYGYVMYKDTSFDAKRTVNGTTIEGNFRAKADGSLYVNEWYGTGEGTWYYYGGDGRAVSGIRKIGGKTYYFSSNGAMQKNTDARDDDDNLWAVTSKGTAVLVPENDWATADGDWYYNNGGKLAKNVTLTINEKMYYFDSYGKMLKNQRIYNPPVYYRAGKDGDLYRNQWYGYEYYGSNGRAADGLYSVDGSKYYYFKNGIAQRNGYFSDDGYLYYAGSNGVVSKVTKDGLYYSGDYNEPYVVTNGMLDQEPGWKKINGKYYYVKEYGNVYLDTKVKIGDDYYIFNDDGSMVTGGWTVYNTRFCYVTGSGALLTGSQKIGNKWYYFDSTGEMRTGPKLVDGVWYMYGQNGVYVGKAKEGWNELDGIWYYLKDGKFLTGEQKIGKATYYFESDYSMRVSYVSSASDYRIWGEDGKLVTGGWVELNGSWYYVDPETGNYVRSQSYYEINGKHYSFSSSGVLQYSEYYYPYEGVIYGTDSDGAIVEKGKMSGTWTLVNGMYYYKDFNYTGWVGDYYVSYGQMLRDTVVSGYYIGIDGKKVTKQGWYHTYSSYYGDMIYAWYYIKSDGKIANSEWLKIDGKWYYFNGRTMVTTPFISDDKLYLINGKGQLEKTVDHPDDGWYTVDGKWYYVKAMTIENGTFIKDTGTFFYVENLTREMVTDTVNGNGSVGYYYFDKDGKADRSLRGWKQVGGKWYYFGRNGEAFFGWINVNSKTYAVGYGIGMLTGYYVIGSKLYQFGSDGALVGQVQYKEGWVEKGGNWYYMKDGAAAADEILSINGKYYAFDRYGRMMKNSFDEDGYYYAGADGALIRNAWKKIGGSWYYFDRFGNMLRGWQKINGKAYLFGREGKLIK